MTRQGRPCDHCGRPIRRKPGFVVGDHIFCKLACKRRFPAAMRHRLIAHYRRMADDASAWVSCTLEWNQTHPDEQPVDVEPLRLVNYGALEIVAALRIWGPIPERALRLIHSAMADSGQ